jgi:hypothetical protein
MKKSRPLLWLLAMLGVLLIAGVVLSNFQQEVGLAEPGSSGRAAVAAAAQVDRALSSGAGYEEFSEVLRVALVAHRNMVVSNTADVALEHMLSDILDCYQAAREAWQADIEGAWNAETYGDPAYWRAAHPGLEIRSAGVLEVEDVKRACRARASETLAQVLRSVGS